MRNSRIVFLKSIAIALLTVVLSALSFGQKYQQTNLVSNIAKFNPQVMDPNLQNAWGLVSSPTSPWWVSNNAGGTSTLYDASGLLPGGSGNIAIVPINGTGTVIIPPSPNTPSPGMNQPPLGSPTGVMFNGNMNDFSVDGHHSIFLFVTEDGTVQGWPGGPTAIIGPDNSVTPSAKKGAVYKGSTIIEVDGQRFILAANFRSGRIDVFDSNLNQVDISEEAFDDDEIPHGYAPFNVQAYGPNVYVTYAKQDQAKHDPVGGPGRGFVSVFNRRGRLVQRLQHGFWFNAPWGVVLTPGHFGEFSHALLIGNFRGGTIAAFNPITGGFIGNMLNPDGTTLNIDGLWALQFGNNAKAGPSNALFFTAGPDGEMDGLLGVLAPVPAELGEDDEL